MTPIRIELATSFLKKVILETEGETMTKIRTLFATLILALVISGSALAGETQTPPCAPVPGETQTPPCPSSLESSDAMVTGETQAPPESVAIVSLTELALDLLLF